MNSFKLLSLAAALGSISVGTARAAYTVQDVIYPTDPTFTQLLGINDAGTVAGYHGAVVN